MNCPGLGLFRTVVLVSSEQDGYVARASARVAVNPDMLSNPATGMCLGRCASTDQVKKNRWGVSCVIAIVWKQKETGHVCFSYTVLRQVLNMTPFMPPKGFHL